MKTLRMFSLLTLAICGTLQSYGQAVEAEVPGDNFSLEGALELFKQSGSPEEFERLLNSPDSKVNNLDLNGDGYIDYIRVHDRYEGNVHAFIIQAVIAERELQDIAVVTLEKLANGRAVLQIIGDEDIYGIETIIEPTQEVRTYAGARTNRTVINVWAWPSVQYVYGPYYSGWVSPWGWYDRPVWWHPWRPVAYVHYHPIWRPYYSYYSVCNTRRVVYAHEIYHPYRSTSVIVHHRHGDRVNRYRSHYDDRDRYEGRRSYAGHDRSTRNGAHPERSSDSYRNSRSAANNEVTPSSGRWSSIDRRTGSSERTFSPDRARAGGRSMITPERDRGARRHVQSSPSLDTENSSPVRSREARPAGRQRSDVNEQRPVGRERSAVNERSLRTEVRSNPTEIRRGNVPDTRPSENIRRERFEPQPTRSSSVDRRSSPPARSVERQVPVQRSSPAPRVERPAARSSGSHATPPRSSSHNREARPAQNSRGRR